MKRSIAGTFSGLSATYPGALVSRLASTANHLCGACPEGTKCAGGSVLLPPDIEIGPVESIRARKAPVTGCVKKMSICGSMQQVPLQNRNYLFPEMLYSMREKPHSPHKSARYKANSFMGWQIFIFLAPNLLFEYTECGGGLGPLGVGSLFLILFQCMDYSKRIQLLFSSHSALVQAEFLSFVIIDNLRRPTVNISYILRESSKTFLGYAEYATTPN